MAFQTITLAEYCPSIEYKFMFDIYNIHIEDPQKVKQHSPSIVAQTLNRPATKEEANITSPTIKRSQ
jgi:hypothetical protein